MSILQINKPIQIRISSSTMSKIRFRKHVSMPGLLSTVRRVFAAVPDPVKHRGFTIVDCLMSGAAVFKFKSPLTP
ncbi:MAG: hypothetical protein OXF46_10850 [Rhodobacteraceae bacterium]|nr:hypothetical protein [Paracoccaceae bacterium]